MSGPPFDTATTLIDGTPTDTLAWYQGEAGASPARSTAFARVDSSITVSYGMRANEQAMRLGWLGLFPLAIANIVLTGLVLAAWGNR